MMVLDSDHCVAILRGRLNLAAHVSPETPLAVTAISVGELTHGVHRSSHPAENMARLNVLLDHVQVLPFDEDAARRFGELKAELEQVGTPLADLDLQIASVVLTHRLTLVTHNQQHFQRVPDLRLDDWLVREP